ncbi:MAG: phosphodiester glycosidase family protein [Bacteroidales bacterium]
MKGIFWSGALIILSLSAGGQTLPDSNRLTEIEWNSRPVAEGVVLKWVQTRLFDSDQAVYVVETDTTAGRFEFGVAACDKPVITSSYAAGEGVLAAINGTFFNMQQGYNVHFVRVNDSVVAYTDEKEYGIRATGVFTATGEAVDISAWGPEKEDIGVVTAEDAIVSGPLLTDNGNDIVLDSINFNKNRHPRSLLGITANGHVLFIAVDGRQPGYADGMSLFELRQLARSLGCTEILNLDGGGSTTLYVKGEGDNGVVNRPSGKVERPVPSIVFVKVREN